MSGSGNVIQLGDNSYVMDWGSDGETITVGANSQVNANSNVTINATHGGDTVVAYWNSTINANNDDISVVTGSVNGNNNTIQSNYGNASLNLIGSNNSVNLTYSNNIVNLDGHNNTVFFNADDTSQLITTENGDYVEERADGSIWSSSASVNIKGGVVTLGFGDGNKVVISGSKSGLLTDTQVNQLVSAMASYTTGSDGVSSSSTAQAPVDLSQLFASSHH
ncbi:hypothetical protein [Paraburkholderia caribensis]|nr:hypothetical protein [Paraburkholderia caribensis]